MKKLLESLSKEHEVGDLNCPDCTFGWPMGCKCGGLLHNKFLGQKIIPGGQVGISIPISRLECDSCGQIYDDDTIIGIQSIKEGRIMADKKDIGDNYEELREASPEELLEAVCGYFDKLSGTENFVAGLRLGFKIAGPDGWKEVASAWLIEYRALCDKLLISVSSPTSKI